MADKKLNEVPKVTDMAYVPVIMSDGSIGQIAKADHASVVAGVMNLRGLFPFMNKGITSTFDVTDVGFYQIGNATEDSGLPVGAYGFGILIVLGVKNYTAQIFISDAYSRMYVRTKNTGNYTSWKTLSVE